MGWGHPEDEGQGGWAGVEVVEVQSAILLELLKPSEELSDAL